MRAILASAVVLVLLTGCDGSGGISGFLASGDLAKARDLFVRVQQRDAKAAAELEQRATVKDTAAAFFAGLANDPAVIKDGDAARAAGFYQVALRKSAGAKHNLALLILKGTVVRSGQDMSAAVQLLNGAADQDLLASMLMLASLYDSGWPGIEQNSALAAEWYERAMTYSNDPRAVARLGAAYQDGVGRPQDLAKAEPLLLVAAKAGIAEAQYRMARTAQNPVQVAQWLTVAALEDRRYERTARDALSGLTVRDRARAESAAALWRHAHDRRQDLVSFTSPVLEP